MTRHPLGVPSWPAIVAMSAADVGAATAGARRRSRKLRRRWWCRCTRRRPTRRRPESSSSKLLRQFPPNVGQVLRYDPSLLTRADYLAPYPQLVAFLQQHPEIARNSSFYFGGYDYYERRGEPMPPEVEALGVLLGGHGGVLGSQRASSAC